MGFFGGLYQADKNVYYFPGESRMAGRDIYRTSDEMVALFENLSQQFPIISIEDGLQEDDFEGWQFISNKDAHNNRIDIDKAYNKADKSLVKHAFHGILI